MDGLYFQSGKKINVLNHRAMIRRKNDNEFILIFPLLIDLYQIVPLLICLTTIIIPLARLVFSGV